jgi:hypothetical protein
VAFLASGRVVPLQLDPPLARVDRLHDLAHQHERTADRRGVEIERTQGALARLAAAIAADTARLSARARRRRSALRVRLAAAEARARRSIDDGLAELRAAADRRAAQERSLVRRLRRRGLWDQLVVASALPLFAAYGRRADPVAEENVTLALLTAIWLMGDELTDALSERKREPDAPFRDADLWSYVAPFANLGAGWLLMRDRRHERFLTGITRLGPPRLAPGGHVVYRAELPLLDELAPDLLPPGAAAVATVVRFEPPPEGGPAVDALRWTVRASADPRGLELTIVLSAGARGPHLFPPAVTVAWMVDTQEAPHASAQS